MTGSRLVALDHMLFRLALTALAEPGHAQMAPPGIGGPSLVQGIVEAIWEPTTPVCAAAGMPDVRGRQVGPEAASVLVTSGDDAQRLAKVSAGTVLAPEQATTVLILAADARTLVVLDGPGLHAQTPAWLPMTPEAIAERNVRCASPPLGLDLILVDGTTVTGLPRTTTVEVLRP